MSLGLKTGATFYTMKMEEEKYTNIITRSCKKA